MDVLTSLEEREDLTMDCTNLQGIKSMQLEEIYANFINGYIENHKDVTVGEIEVSRLFLDYLKRNLK